MKHDELKIGDRVRLIENGDDYDPDDNPSGPAKGAVGIVRGINTNMPEDDTCVAVEFDEAVGHDGFPYVVLKSGHGWFVRPAILERVDAE